MKLLIAEDNIASRKLLENLLRKWNYDVVSAKDGIEAWEILKQDNSPELVILDWDMPGLEGVEVCRKVREKDTSNPKYIIMLTARTSREDIVYGLDMGANDYIQKPFSKSELQARLRVGKRMLELQSALNSKIKELKDAIHHIKTLQGILPICMYCHKIRTDDEAWERIESYLEKNTDAKFSHGLCPECLDKYYPEVGNKKK